MTFESHPGAALDVQDDAVPVVTGRRDRFIGHHFPGQVKEQVLVELVQPRKIAPKVAGVQPPTRDGAHVRRFAGEGWRARELPELRSGRRYRDGLLPASGKQAGQVKRHPAEWWRHNQDHVKRLAKAAGRAVDENAPSRLARAVPDPGSGCTKRFPPIHSYSGPAYLVPARASSATAACRPSGPGFRPLPLISPAKRQVGRTPEGQPEPITLRLLTCTEQNLGRPGRVSLGRTSTMTPRVPLAAGPQLTNRRRCVSRQRRRLSKRLGVPE